MNDVIELFNKFRVGFENKSLMQKFWIIIALKIM